MLGDQERTCNDWINDYHNNLIIISFKLRSDKTVIVSATYDTRQDVVSPN